jgi:hypothetical protein
VKGVQSSQTQIGRAASEAHNSNFELRKYFRNFFWAEEIQEKPVSRWSVVATSECTMTSGQLFSKTSTKQYLEFSSNLIENTLLLYYKDKMVNILFILRILCIS